MPQKETKYDTVTVFRSAVEVADTLKTDAERGKFYSAYMHYSLYGEEPSLSGICKSFFELLKPNIKKSNKRRDARLDREKKQTNEKQNAPQNGNKTVTNEDANDTFCSPFALHRDKDGDKDEDKDLKKNIKKKDDSTTNSPEEILPYPKNNKGGIVSVQNAGGAIGYAMTDEEAEQFIAYYEAVGWRIKNQPVRNWKALLVTWRNTARNQVKPKGKPKHDLDKYGI